MAALKPPLKIMSGKQSLKFVTAFVHAEKLLGRVTITAHTQMLLQLLLILTPWKLRLTSFKTNFAIIRNIQVKQAKSTKGTLHRHRHMQAGRQAVSNSKMVSNDLKLKISRTISDQPEADAGLLQHPRWSSLW